MTAKQLVKRLEAIIAQYGNIPVAVDWDTFRMATKNWDQPIFWEPMILSVESVYLADPDGGTMTNKDGTERMRNVVVIRA